MKNQEIIYLVNAGVLQMTNHNLPAAQAYKAYKFRKAVSRALDAIQETEKGLLKEAGIEDAQAFDKRRDELRALKAKNSLSGEQAAELKAKTAAFDKYMELRRQMLEEKADLEGVKTIPYEDWKTLQDENKAVGESKSDLLSGHVEMLLEGVLWAAPEEEGDKAAASDTPAQGDRPAE